MKILYNAKSMFYPSQWAQRQPTTHGWMTVWWIQKYLSEAMSFQKGTPQWFRAGIGWLYWTEVKILLYIDSIILKGLNLGTIYHFIILLHIPSCAQLAVF